MFDSTRRVCALICVALLAIGAAAAEDRPKFAEELLDGTIVTPAGNFDSWAEYVQSDYFRENGLRCGAAFEPDTTEAATLGNPADCTYNLTDPDPIYDPSIVRYRIPVVVHVIQSTSGSGFLSEADVQSQIDILNEDFLALPGTNGALGNDAQIEFYRPTEDPDGNPSNGITYSTNNTWYNDGGGYYNTLAWDTNRYLNIYTNTASGALGYVPDLPQGGIAGSNQDRVVILWSAFGRNSAFGPPFNQGRTATHEVGHYLGLYHTFSNGCGSASSCYTTGDRICDTPQESSPSSGCPTSKATCGSNDPEENYMDYSNDLCMTEFTVEQNYRMRCSLEGYREDLFELVSQLCGNDTIDDGEQCDDGNLIPGDGCDLFCRVESAPTEISPPFSAEPLRFTDSKTLRWESAELSRSETFNLYRGLVGDLSSGDYGICLAPGLEQPSTSVLFNPPVGVSWSFLVSGENSYGEGTLGQKSAGGQRAGVATCP